jgi:hypothetical protein
MLLMAWAQAKFSGNTHIIDTYVCVPLTLVLLFSHRCGSTISYKNGPISCKQLLSSIITHRMVQFTDH